MRFTQRLDGLLGAIGAVVLFGMMALTFVDVIMRYVFNASLRGAFEITELMMVILIYAGLPVVSRHNLHVTTDLIDRFLSPRVRRVLGSASTGPVATARPEAWIASAAASGLSSSDARTAASMSVASTIGVPQRVDAGRQPDRAPGREHPRVRRCGEAKDRRQRQGAVHAAAPGAHRP